MNPKEAGVDLKVLLVGINAYAKAPLKGCVNDTTRVRELIEQRYGLTTDGLRLLVDDAATKAAISDGLRWLAAPGDGDEPPVRMFHFSGHGTFIADQNGDEPDGRDECIVPYDYETTGPMTDDTLHELYSGFPANGHLLIAMDCCHSGTIQRQIAEDIRYRFLENTYAEVQQMDEAARRIQSQRDTFVIEQLSDLRERAVPQDEWERRIKQAMTSFDKKHFGEDSVNDNVVLLAACRADQTAADACFAGSYNGALTYFLTEVLRESGPGLTYATLIDQVGSKLYANTFVQLPQLECNPANHDRPFLNHAL
jgi:hypothetical protein